MKQRDSWSEAARSLPFYSLLLLSLLVGSTTLYAQMTAEAYFHKGAKLYIGGKDDEAKAEVAQGLASFPDDVNLQRLNELLNQPPSPNQDQNQQEEDQDDQNESKDQQQQQNQEKNQQQSEEQKQDQSKDSSSEQQSEQNQEGQDKKDQEGQQGEQGKKDEESQEKPEDKNGASGQPNEDQPPPTGDTNSLQAIPMSPQEAQRLLDSIKGDERTLIFLPPQLITNRNRTLKNW